MISGFVSRLQAHHQRPLESVGLTSRYVWLNPERSLVGLKPIFTTILLSLRFCTPQGFGGAATLPRAFCGCKVSCAKIQASNRFGLRRILRINVAQACLNVKAMCGCQRRAGLRCIPMTAVIMCTSVVCEENQKDTPQIICAYAQANQGLERC